MTTFLASLAQATHNLVPPDVLEPLVLKIANEFVSEAAAPAVATAGLNSIREICARQPLAMNDTLLQDLVAYRKSKDKGTMMASKGILSLYREAAPEMLKRRDRGKDASIGISSDERKERRFGEDEEGEIEGIELLEKWKEEERAQKRAGKGLEDAETDSEDEDEEDWGAWEQDDEGEDSDGSGGWIAVESDEEINIPDSDEDGQHQAKKSKISNESPDVPKTAESEMPAIAYNELRMSTLATTKVYCPYLSFNLDCSGSDF